MKERESEPWVGESQWLPGLGLLPNLYHSKAENAFSERDVVPNGTPKDKPLLVHSGDNQTSYLTRCAERH